MSNVYCKFDHNYAYLRNAPPAVPGECRGPHPILLMVGDRVWMLNDYHLVGIEGVLHVGDGTSNGFDEDGQCIVSIPAAWCTFMDEAVAESVSRCIEEDQKLLSYAR